MGFEEISGNERVRAYLEGAFARKTVPHAFLLSGAPGSGKRALAALLARALVCSGEKPPCGACPACKKALHDTHPDITLLDPKTASIKVKDIRAIRQNAFVLPNDGARKVYVIYHADQMTQEAQDALLKILEEPPEFTAFILLCYNHHSLLPTVLSRVTHLKLYTQEDAVLLNPNEEALACAENIAKALATREELPILQALVACEKKKRDEMTEVLELLSATLRDAMMRNVSDAFTPILPAARESALCMAQKMTMGEMQKVYELCREASGRIMKNIGVSHINAMFACRAFAALA